MEIFVPVFNKISEAIITNKEYHSLLLVSKLFYQLTKSNIKSIIFNNRYQKIDNNYIKYILESNISEIKNAILEIDDTSLISKIIKRYRTCKIKLSGDVDMEHFIDIFLEITNLIEIHGSNNIDIDILNLISFRRGYFYLDINLVRLYKVIRGIEVCSTINRLVIPKTTFLDLYKHCVAIRCDRLRMWEIGENAVIKKSSSGINVLNDENIKYIIYTFFDYGDRRYEIFKGITTVVTWYQYVNPVSFHELENYIINNKNVMLFFYRVRVEDIHLISHTLKDKQDPLTYAMYINGVLLEEDICIASLNIISYRKLPSCLYNVLTDHI